MWLKWCRVSELLCDHKMPMQLKEKVYKIVINPVTLCGAKFWPATTKHEQTHHAMEMQMLSWMLGHICYDHVSNEDVHKMMGVVSITENMCKGWCNGTTISYSGKDSPVATSTRKAASWLAKEMLARQTEGRHVVGKHQSWRCQMENSMHKSRPCIKTRQTLGSRRLTDDNSHCVN